MKQPKTIIKYPYKGHLVSGEGIAKLLCFYIGLLTILISGCSLKEIHDQAESLDRLSRIQGNVEIQTVEGGTAYVQLYQPKDQYLQLVRKQSLHGSNEYHFDVLPGTYMIGVFVDANEDGEWQANEPTDYLGVENSLPTPVDVKEDQIIDIKTLVVKESLLARPDVVVQKRLSKSFENIGTIITLDDPMFSRANASMGFWRPFDFVEQYGGGLMMLQEYDKRKTPIVFVHGIFGTSLEFEKMILELDQDKYQPWVLHYPSGVGLDLVSDYFLQALDQLYIQYGFAQVSVVAHSMGGLMTRSFVMRHQQNEQAFAISLVVTINSPLYGMDGAATGVKTSPIVIPAWRDVASGSAFIERVHDWEWPKEIPYHLVYSHLPGKDSDGVVPLNSQLSQSLQHEAVATHEFEAQHAEILVDPEFIQRFNGILEDY